MRKPTEVIAASLLGIILALGLTSCGSSAQSSNNINNDGQKKSVQTSDPTIKFSDGSYIKDKCDGHGHRVYTGSSKWTDVVSIAVIDDASCPGGK